MAHIPGVAQHLVDDARRIGVWRAGRQTRAHGGHVAAADVGDGRGAVRAAQRGDQVRHQRLERRVLPCRMRRAGVCTFAGAEPKVLLM